MHRFDACRSIDLAHVEGIKRDIFWQVAIRTVHRARDTDRTKAQHHLGMTSGTAGNSRQFQNKLLCDRQIIEMGEQVASAGQRTIRLGAHQQFDFGRPTRKGRIEITFTIGDHSHTDRTSLSQDRRRLRAGQPSARFSLIRRSQRILRNRTVALPQLHIEQSKDDPAVRIDHQHGMDQESRVGSVAGSAECGFAALVLGEVDLARILDGQHTAATYLLQQMRSGFGNQLCLAHSLVAQKSPEGLLARFVAAKPFDRYRPPQHHATEQLPPLFCSRSSPNAPISCAIAIAASLKKTASNGITNICVAPHIPRHLSQHDAPERCVHAVAPDPSPPRARARGGRGEERIAR